ncbi:hypothetical protein ACYZT3_21105 [Pseudomonas sp. MDT1-16]
MSSYIIHIEHREEQDLAWVEINALSQESKSARRCRFQTIGWILSIVDTVNKKVDPRIVEDEDYAKKALIKFAKMDEASADLLLSARDWRRRFEAVWPTLDDEQREHALRYDYDDWDNYWPGFDTFNRTLYEQYFMPQPNVAQEKTYDTSSTMEL